MSGVAAGPEWDRRYARIRRKFGYSLRRDVESARLLDSVLDDGGNRIEPDRLGAMISERPVFVVGAGPSLPRSLPVLKKFKGIPVIAADGAVRFLVGNGIWADIIVTDLDGDEAALRRSSRKGIMVVHAHGDNAGRIPMAGGFPRCIGTTQSRPFGGLLNFGGFTDGDRAVFLADHFGAERIILLGMDFGDRIGAHSDTKRSERRTKLRKLAEAESLVSQLAERSRRIYSTSAIRGAVKVGHAEIGNIIIT